MQLNNSEIYFSDLLISLTKNEEIFYIYNIILGLKIHLILYYRIDELYCFN